MENFINSVGIEKIILFVLIFNVVLLIGFIALKAAFPGEVKEEESDK